MPGYKDILPLESDEIKMESKTPKGKKEPGENYMLRTANGNATDSSDSDDEDAIKFRDYVFQKYNCDSCKCSEKEDLGTEPRMSIPESMCFWFHEIWALFLSTPCCVLDGLYMAICLIAQWSSNWGKTKLFSFVPKFKILSPDDDLLEDYGYLEENSSFGGKTDLGEESHSIDVVEEKEYPEIYTEAIKKTLSDIKNGKHKARNEQKLRDELIYVCTNNFVRKFLAIQSLMGAEEVVRIRSKGMSLLQIALHNHSRDVALELLRSKNKDMVLSLGNHSVTALHLAIMQNDMELVERCLECVSDDIERKQLLHVQTTVNLSQESTPAVALPLALAVWNANEKIFNKLVDAGAELDYVDREGYSILHTTVFMSGERPEEACAMYDMIMNRALHWWQTRENLPPGKFPAMEVRYHLLNQRSKDDLLNPLALAAHKGFRKMLEKILDTEYVYKFTVMKFGYKDIAYYDVTDLDPVLVQYKSTPSVIEQLIISTKDSTLQCLHIPILEHLLDTKWNNYFLYYLVVFLGYLVYMILLTLSIPEEPPDLIFNASTNGNDTSNKLSVVNMMDYLLDLQLTKVEWCIFGGTAIIWLFGVTSLLASLMLLARRRFRYREILLTYKRIILFLFIIAFAVVIFIWIGLRLKSHPLQKIFLVVALVFGWSFLIVFMHGFEPTAFFSVMVERTLTKDMMLFGFCYVCISLGFTSGFVVNMAFDSKERLDSYSDIKAAFFTLFRTMLGFADPEELFDRHKFSLETYVINICLFIGFVFFTTILLLNMLIASMTNTYAEVSEHGALFYKKLRAFNVHLIEQTLPSVLQYFSSYYTLKTYELKRRDGETIVRKVHLCRIG